MPATAATSTPATIPVFMPLVLPTPKGSQAMPKPLTIAQLIEQNRQALAVLIKRVDSNHAEMVVIVGNLKIELDDLKAILAHSGLNGDSVLLREFLAEYKQEHDLKRSYASVRTDVMSKLRFLAAPKRLLVVFITAIAGALAWQLVSGHPVHIPGFS